MKTTVKTAAIMTAAIVLSLAGCDTFQHLIAGNEDNVANTIDNAGSIASGAVGTLLPPPFNVLAAAAVTGLVSWFTARVRAYGQGVSDLKKVVASGRTSNSTFNESFNSSPAGEVMKKTLSSNTRLTRAFNKGT